jgi:membrane protein YdbS with pleckstrin-like domain
VQNGGMAPKRRLYIPVRSGASNTLGSGMQLGTGMGRYIEDILQPGEKVLYSTTIHGIVYAPGLLCLAGAGACLVASGGGVIFPLAAVGALLGLAGVFLVVKAWFQRWITETDVTSLRVVHKEGFIQRQTFEISLDKIESVDVTQSILGRIFGWGDVKVNGVGEGTKTIKMIGAPIEFRNHITAR